jgi:hypothetical protein
MSMYLIQSYAGDGVNAIANFSNIPQTFEHLRAIISVRSSANATTGSMACYFNDSTTSNSYYIHNTYGDGSSPYTAGVANNQFTTYNVRPNGGTSTANTFGGFVMDFVDYKSSTKNKTIRVTGGSDSGGTGINTVGIISGVWLSNSPITKISFNTETAFSVGTVIDLYGINSRDVTGA